jgi:hypothetical protein
MSTGRNSPPSCCQLPTVCEGTRRPTWKDRFRQFLLRMLSALERRLEGYRQKLSPVAPPKPKDIRLPILPPESMCHVLSGAAEADAGPAQGERPAVVSTLGIQPGDWVEVLSYEEIRATLDDKNTFQGLQFMEGMKRFCGQRLRVRKEVRMLFDERAWRMLRVRRPRYLLDDAICDGKGMFDQEGCDRSCFFFWAEAWLRKP